MLVYGWIPDPPDRRDYTREDFEKMLEAVDTSLPHDTPGSCDFRGDFPPVYDQGRLGSCTANAAAGIIQYYTSKVYGKPINPSRLFIYYNARRLLAAEVPDLDWRGDTGATIRHTMKSISYMGAPPEDRAYGTEYDPRAYNRGYDAFHYSLADNLGFDEYHRCDPAGAKPDDIIEDIRVHLAARIPVEFGFMVYDNPIREAASDGTIRPPAPEDKPVGGHAVLAVGYDDHMGFDGAEDDGALIIRNSWGDSWGDRGYGYLSYDYIRKGLAADFWAVSNINYIPVILVEG